MAHEEDRALNVSEHFSKSSAAPISHRGGALSGQMRMYLPSDTDSGIYCICTSLFLLSETLYKTLYNTYLLSHVCAQKNGIIRAKVTIVKSVSKLFQTQLCTLLQPLRGPSPRPSGRYDWERCSRTSVPAHNFHLLYPGGAGGKQPISYTIFRIRCYFSTLYVPRETISIIIIFLVCNKVEIKVHSYGYSVCNCKSII